MKMSRENVGISGLYYDDVEKIILPDQSFIHKCNNEYRFSQRIDSYIKGVEING